MRHLEDDNGLSEGREGELDDYHGKRGEGYTGGSNQYRHQIAA